MKVIITESAEQRLKKRLIKESSMSDKVSIIKDFLDSNFLKATNSIIGDDGLPKDQGIVIMVDKYKQPKKYLSDVDLFYLLQDQFKNIISADNDDEDNEEDELTDDIKDIFDDAVKKAEKKIGKKVTHNNRDNFLKQVIKDWYYNRISEYGSLSEF